MNISIVVQYCGAALSPEAVFLVIYAWQAIFKSPGVVVAINQYLARYADFEQVSLYVPQMVQQLACCILVTQTCMHL